MMWRGLLKELLALRDGLIAGWRRLNRP